MILNDFLNADEDSKIQQDTNSKASMQQTLQVRFFTQIADKSMQCDDTIYALTSKLRPKALSQVLNHVLKKKHEQCIDFDFLINNKYITTSLAEHLSINKISSEKKLDIEYIEKTIEPSAKSTNEHPDWISCVDAIKRNVFITGCYDGIIRVWKPEGLFCEYQAHNMAIKGITALYSKLGINNIYYFASVSKDRSVRVFGLNENNKKIEQVGAVNLKLHNKCHSLSVECCSAPFPSKVFATGSADKEIRIYRMKNKDVVDDDNGTGNKEGPPMKKRKLNMVEQKVNNFVNDSDDVKMNDNDNDNVDVAMEWSTLSNISTLRGHMDVVKCIDWCNSYALYSGSWDSNIKVWDVHKEIDIYTWNTQSAVSCIKYWSAQNVLISAHSNQKIAIWDPRTDRNISGKTMSEMTFRSHRLAITGIDVDGLAGDNSGRVKNSDYLFISSSHDGKLKIWDIRSKSPLYTIQKHKGKALCVGWYGNTIVSGGSDCKLHSVKWNK